MLKRNVSGLLSVALFTLCLVISVVAQVRIPPGQTTSTGMGGGNAITGMVVISNGQRILDRRITVRLQSMTRGDVVATTDEYGKFAFTGLSSGDYTIVVNKEADYEPFSQVVTV